jgi:uroporphyrin-III C-methyltransferase
MTDDNASTNGTGTDDGSAGQPRTEPPTPSKASGGGKVLAGIALVLAIAAAGVTGYLWYQVQIEQRLAQSEALTDVRNSVNTANVNVTALEKELDALREQQRDLGARIDTQVQARLDELSSQQNTLAERSEALSGSIEKVYEDLDRSLDSWALEEVEQLLRIANHSLQLSGDVSTAVAGLELADRRLEELANPAFLPVRERLADNITALKSLDPVDTPGLSLRLAGMAAKVEGLPLDETTQRPIVGGSAESEDAGSADPGAESNRWLDAGGELLQDLSKLVRIQNIEEPAKPLLAPDQRYFLYNNLRLMFSGAQIAALRKDTATFRENLEQAAGWIRDYFDTGHQGVQQLLSDVESMSGNELSPELPDISGSLNELQQAKRRMASQ